ncbi:MAG: hypothetical protein HND53_05395 [Proteobacteria bacterium]|nr:hypothetical protein [Pseudomonadota bacterium]NOG59916.1 hypothetical protein [Pseudomonadota bacterium]
MVTTDKNIKLANRLSILAPALYLLNLLLLPGLSFLILAILYIKFRQIEQTTARVQLQQNFYISIVSGLVIVGISIIIMIIGDLSSVYSWMVMIIYVLSIHAILALLGAFSLAKGINQQAYIYPGLSFISKRKI